MTLDEATTLARNAREIRLRIKRIRSDILGMEHRLALARSAGASDDELRGSEIMIKEMRAFLKDIL